MTAGDGRGWDVEWAALLGKLDARAVEARQHLRRFERRRKPWWRRPFTR